MPVLSEGRRLGSLGLPMSRRAFLGGVALGGAALLDAACTNKRENKTSPTLEEQLQTEQDKNHFIALKSGTRVKLVTWTGTKPDLVPSNATQIKLINPSKYVDLQADIEVTLLPGEHDQLYNDMLAQLGVKNGKGVILSLSSPDLRENQKAIDEKLTASPGLRTEEGYLPSNDLLFQQHDILERGLFADFLTRYDKSTFDKINQLVGSDLALINLALILPE